jgi:hypothetical protein
MAGSVGDVNNYRRPFPTVITLNYILHCQLFSGSFRLEKCGTLGTSRGHILGDALSFSSDCWSEFLGSSNFNQLTLIYIWVCLNIEYNPPNGCFKREYDNQPMVILMGTVFSDKPIFFFFLF